MLLFNYKTKTQSVNKQVIETWNFSKNLNIKEQ